MTTYTLKDLVGVARSDRPNDRNLLAESLGKIVLEDGRRLTETEQTLIYDILRRLVHRVEMRVRRGLADTLAERSDTPRDLVVTLANDVIEVAHPILTRSTVLTDTDLIELILEHTDQHKLAITKRPSLSESVTEQVLETGDDALIGSVLQNQGAAISADSMARLVDASAKKPALRAPLAQRDDLPPRLAARMAGWVGEALRTYLRDKLQAQADAMTAPAAGVSATASVDQAVAAAMNAAEAGGDGSAADPLERLDQVIAGAAAAARDPLSGDPLSGDPLSGDPLSGDPMDGFRPHPRMLVRALEDGDIFRFEELFRDYTGLSEASVTRILYDAGPEALAIACKAAGIDGYSFSDILCHLHGAGDMRRYRETRAYLKVMDYFERIDDAGARRVVAAWRNNDATD
ncbi:MAG: DUF2336 domain-containing protein [Alphaproteobacteria bacterium]|nr:DUF2336 domain-containing protein [Alphaproteobacteria bacterium]